MGTVLVYAVRVGIRSAFRQALKQIATMAVTDACRELAKEHLKEHGDRLIRRGYAAFGERLAKQEADAEQDTEPNTE